MVTSPHRGVTLLAALGILLAAGAAAAQGRCTMDQLAGTFAFESHGSSTFVLGPAPPRHWSLTSAPFVFVGWFALRADGLVAGEGWVILGRVTSGLEAQPIQGQLVELEKDTCAAVLEWSGSPVPGGPPGFHRERLAFVDNGREFRSLLIQSPSATMAWTGRGNRITHAPGPVQTCGPHQLRGDVLVQCEWLSGVASATVPASAAAMFMLTVDRDGLANGTSYAKAPGYVEQTVEGHIGVEASCKVEARLESPALPGVVQHGRGMIFDEGKAGFLILPFVTTQPDGSTQSAFARCELLSLGR